MENEMKKLLELAKKNMDQCPWMKKQVSERYIDELADEMKELREAYSKSDWKNAQEELGDIIWDALTLAHMMEREGKAKASDIVIGTHDKIARRKPWLLTGETVSWEDAGRIWKENKEKEKNGRT